MSTIFVDRESAYPNRYRVIPESGEEYYAVLARADEPITPGTPLNAETFNGMRNEIDAELAAKAPAIESTEYPGCYYRMVEGVKEWLNPPMLIGVEYRTTERRDGNPVYTKMIDFGALPNNTTKNIIIGIGYADIVHIDVIFYNSKVNASYTVEQSVTCAVYQNNINITTQSDMTHVSAKFIIKYTQD